jgi:hypothetical protein
MDKMVEQFETSQNKITTMLKQRENDIRSILDSHKDEIIKYENIISGLKEENECHKQNILGSNKNLKKYS